MPIDNYFLPVYQTGQVERVEIRLPRKMGVMAKVYLQNMAKQLAEYNKPIKVAENKKTTKKDKKDIEQKSSLDMKLTDQGQTQHKNDTVDVNKINSLGKWLFGISGYTGNIKVSNPTGTIAYIEYPKNSPEIVCDLFTKLRQRVQK